MDDKSTSSTEETKVVSMNLRMIYAAAVVALIVGVAAVWQIIGPASPEAIYAEYHEIAPGPSLTRSAEENGAWEDFIEKYRENSYDDALVQLHLAETSGFEPTYLIRYYQGICIMNLAQPDFRSAIDRFDQVLAGDNDYHAVSLWLIGLSQLQLEEFVEARKTFELLKENFPSHAEKAAELLEDLD